LREIQTHGVAPAGALFVFRVGIPFARPPRRFVFLVFRRPSGRGLPRRKFPLPVPRPPPPRWLPLSGRRAAPFRAPLGVAIAAAVTIFAFTAFIAITARALSRADRVRKTSERHLAAQNVTTCVLVESATLAEAMPCVLEAVCKSLDWVMGVRWSVDSQ